MVEKLLGGGRVYSALFTPTNKDESLNSLALKELVRYELSRGVDGFYCCGSSGEALLLSSQERMAVAEVVVQEVNGKVPVIIHTGALSTREAVMLSQHAEEVGASAVSLIPPVYYKYKGREVAQYYKDVISAVDLGVIVYNIPQFTGISFSKKDPILFESQVIGIKHTSMNLYDLELLHQEFPNKIMFNGFDEIWLQALSAGATASIGTMINICPPLFQQIRSSYLKGDMEKAKSLQSKLNSFVEALVGINLFPGAKYCMDLLGVPLGPCRRPFAELSDKEKVLIKKALLSIERYL